MLEDVHSPHRKMMTVPNQKRPNDSLRVAVFSPNQRAVSETFIRAHIERLPFEIVPAYGSYWHLFNEAGFFWPVLRYPGRALNRVSPGISRWLFARVLAWELKRKHVHVVLAEYGMTGADIMDACRLAKKPLVVHFHGYDASSRPVIEKYLPAYQRLFAGSADIIAVSLPMKAQLTQWGTREDKMHLLPYGVDPHRFEGAAPESAPPQFVAVGRFVEKKAPHLTIQAFREVVKAEPSAKLTMVGEGPLLETIRTLVADLDLNKNVELLGARDHETVSALMRRARAFVQHSVVAQNGDSEGAPVAIIEAQMTGLPVVSTRHAGIPEIVSEGETGFLVEEGDVGGMGLAMARLAMDAGLAGKLGRQARTRALAFFTLDHYLTGLADVLEKAVKKYEP